MVNDRLYHNKEEKNSENNYEVLKNTTDNSNNKKKLLRIILMIIITVVIILLSFSFCSHNKERDYISGNLPDYDDSLSQGIIPGMSQEEVEKILQQAADESMFSFQINSRIQLDNSSSEAKLLLGNPPNNVYDFYIEMVLDDTNEVIYKSGRIPPNHHIEKFKLNKNLGKGDYKATAFFYIFDKKGENIVAKSAAGVNITIKS